MSEKGLAERLEINRPQYVRIAPEAARLYREGLTLKEVGERLGVPPRSVYDALVYAGVPRRKPGPVRRGEPPMEEMRRRARALREVGGLTFREIGEELGVTRQRAHQLVTECGR